MITKIKAVRVQEIIMEGSANILGNIRYNNIDERCPIDKNGDKNPKSLPLARPLFNNFQEIEKIRPLQPYSGDVMFEGRYGQSIRFGSTVKDSQQPNNWSNEGKIGNPITIIRNGQANDSTKMDFEHILEDANRDDSSIYLCSNQQISNFQKAGIGSSNSDPLSYKHMKL